MALLLVTVSPKIPRAGTTGPVPYSSLVCRIAPLFLSQQTSQEKVILGVAVLFLFTHSLPGTRTCMVAWRPGISLFLAGSSQCGLVILSPGA